MKEVEIIAGRRGIREVNEEIREAAINGNRVVVRETLSRHNLGVALPADANVFFEGSVGYYCGGLEQWRVNRSGAKCRLGHG